jgi:type I restriction enzyme S subunit
MLGDIPCPVPRSRHEQQRIANFLDEQTARIDALIAEKTALLDKLDEFRLSSIYQCISQGLTGSATVDTGDDWFPTLPVGWAFCALNYRYEVQLGKMLDEKRLTGEHATPYLRNIDVRWGYVNTDNLPLMDIAPQERDRYTLRAGDLLVCEGGVGVGRTAIWGGSQEVVGYQKALHRVRPRSSRDVPKFLYYQMQDAVWRDRVLGQEKATIPHLTAEAFRRWRLPFPPVADQRAIVAHLDALSERTSTLANHCSLHIDRLREYRSSLISAAVTGQLELGTFKEAA